MASRPSSHQPVPVVSAEARTDALRRARALRIAGHRNDCRYQEFTMAALLERVVAIPCHPLTRRDGTVLVGRILDGLADREWEVWVEPHDRLLSMRPIPPLKPEIPAVTRRPDGRYYDGMRRKWVMPGEEPPGIFATPLVPGVPAPTSDETKPRPAT